MVIRKASLGDLKAVSRFTDFWLSGRGKRVNAPGAVDDCFISPSQHKKYIEKYETWLSMESGTIVAWAVIEPSGTMIHMLVAGDKRGRGIGTAMMGLLRPRSVRSKLDQSTGNPIGFYEKLGYKRVRTVKSVGRFNIDELRPDRRKNIDILIR